MSSSLSVWGIVLILFGLLLAISSLVVKSYRFTKLPYPAYTTARVVEILSVERNRYMQSEFRNRQAAVFEFYADGKLIKIVDTQDVYPCPYRVAENVRLSYHPENPEKYQVMEEDPYGWISIILNTVGVLLILLGALLCVKYAVRFMFLS